MTSYYESRFKFDPKRRTVWKEIVRFLGEYVPENGTVVNLGAGYCDFINQVKARRKVAVDLSEESEQYCHPDVEFFRASVLNLSFLEDGSADVVHASNLLEHFDDRELETIISEIRRILKRNGLLILIQPNFRLAYRHYFDDYTHKKVWSHVSLRDFLTANSFKALLDHPRFLPFSMKSSGMMPIIPLLVRAYIHLPIKPFAGQMLLVSTLDG